MPRRKKQRTIETDIFGLPTEGLENINSKKKGDANERVLCKLLSEWVGQPFTRVPRSGGLRWKGTANVCGDVVCENADYDFPFTVETNHLKSVTLPEAGGKLRENSIFYRVYAQCLEDSDRSGKMPLIFLRENGMPSGEYYIAGDIHKHKKNPANLLAYGTRYFNFRVYLFSEIRQNLTFDQFCNLI